MNRIYRLVWSHRTQSLVVVSEAARGLSKQGGRKKLSVRAISLALAMLNGTAVMAADACGSGTVTINTSQTINDNCVLNPGSNLIVTTNGKIQVTSGAAGVNNPVLVTVAAGSIINAGTISASTSSANIWAIDVNGATAGLSLISNSGLISAYNSGITVTNSAIVGQIVNAQSGTISATTGIVLGGNGQISQGITNAGLINARNGGGIFSSTGSIAGGINNSGTISSTRSAGIYLYNSTVSGGVVNTGTVFGGSTAGIYIGHGSRLEGGLVNNGLIHGVSKGVDIDASSLDGGITNSGIILGGQSAGIYVHSGTITGGISNSGSISGNATSVGAGIRLANSSLVGGIINSGVITGGFGLIASHSTISGGITNISLGTISGGTGIAVLSASRINGGVNNSGKISGVYSGIKINSSSVSGGIVNSGLVEATSGNGNGIKINNSTLSGGILNSGHISGAPGAASGGAIYLRSHSNVVGGITNSGSLTGYEAVIISQSTVTGAISNGSGGIISGNLAGIYVTNATVSGGINNAGQIISTGTGSLAYPHAGIFVDSGSHALNGITNTGTISSADVGIFVNTGATGIGGITNSGLISGTNASLKLTNTTDVISIYNTGTLQGNANIGINTLNLNGSNSRVIGNTTGTGTVNVNGTFFSEGTFNVGTFNVANGGMFNMNNAVTVGGGNFNNSGILNVGSAAQAVTGNYVQGAGGTFRIGLSDTASNYGKLNVNGTSSIAGTVNVVINAGAAVHNGTTIAGVITSTGAMTVTPANLTVTDNSVLYNLNAATVSNPGHALDLIVAVNPTGITDAVATNNPAGTGAAIQLQNMLVNGIPAAMQPVFDRLVNLNSVQVSNAVSQMLPTLVGAGASAGMNALHSMNKIIQSREEAAQGLSSGDDTPDQFGWVRGFGNWANQSDQNSVSGFSSRTSGLVAGGDRPISPSVRAGGSFTYAESRIDGNSSTAPNALNVTTYELVGYASQNLEPGTDINYQIDTGLNHANSSRAITFMGTTASASFDSLALHGSVGIGRQVELDAASHLTPSVRLDYANVRTNGYSETGAGPLNLNVDAQTYKEFVLSGDAKFTQQINPELKWIGNAGLGYDFINQQSQTSSSFAGGGTAFVANGLSVSPWIYRAGLGLIQDEHLGVEYSLRYDAEGRPSGYLNQTLAARVRWAF